MRPAQLVALRTLHQAGQLDCQVGASLTLTGTGIAGLGKGHKLDELYPEFDGGGGGSPVHAPGPGGPAPLVLALQPNPLTGTRRGLGSEVGFRLADHALPD